MPQQLGKVKLRHVPFLTIHHHYVTCCCCPYIVNVVLLTCQESNTKVYVNKKKIHSLALALALTIWMHNVRTVRTTTLHDVKMTYCKERY